MRRLPLEPGALALCATVFLLALPASAENVAVVTASSASEEAAQYLEDQVDSPVERRASVNARRLDALVVEARAWPDDLVVVLDSERASVSVLRPGDGTVGSRTLAPTAAKAPYVVALAAVELLELVRAAPPARAAALPERERSHASRLSLDAGLVQSVGANGDIGLLQPTAGVDFEASRAREALWLGIGIHGTGLVPLQREQVLVQPSGADTRGKVRYERDELSLRLGVGHRHGVGAAVGFCDVGLALIHVSATSSGAGETVSDRRSAFWLGVGGELRYSFGAGLSLGLGAGGVWFPVTTRFYASSPGVKAPVVALHEGALDLRARLAVVWEFPP